MKISSLVISDFNVIKRILRYKRINSMFSAYQYLQSLISTFEVRVDKLHCNCDVYSRLFCKKISFHKNLCWVIEIVRRGVQKTHLPVKSKKMVFKKMTLILRQFGKLWHDKNSNRWWVSVAIQLQSHS